MYAAQVSLYPFSIRQWTVGTTLDTTLHRIHLANRIYDDNMWKETNLRIIIIYPLKPMRKRMDTVVY